MLVILSIVLLIAVPAFLSTVKQAEKDACLAELDLVEKDYETYLVMEGKDHTDVLFAQFTLQNEYDFENCSGKCDVAYIDGEVVCSGYAEEDDVSGGVPFL
nr:hypothetical protein [Oceanobacillus saliphilus]